jgi:hypothetical protein
MPHRNGILGSLSRRLAQRELHRSGVFFAEWYLESYPDIKESGLDPVAHYVQHGARESRDPSPFFDTDFYVSTYPDVSRSGMNPMLHYIERGVAEDRTTTSWARRDGSVDVSRAAALCGLRWPAPERDARNRGTRKAGGCVAAHLPPRPAHSEIIPFERIVICNGMPRSASTWSFNVAMELLRHCVDHDDALHGDYDENIARFLSQAPRLVEHVVVKCHSLDALGRILARSGKAKVVYTRRDVADAVVSSMRMWRQDFEQALAPIEASLELFALHRESGRALLLNYDDIVGSPLRSVQRVAEYLEVAVEPRVVYEVAEATSLERMREKAAQLTRPGSHDRLVLVNDVMHDRESLLHPAHIRDGRSGYGRELLSAEQVARLVSLLARYGIER